MDPKHVRIAVVSVVMMAVVVAVVGIVAIFAHFRVGNLVKDHKRDVYDMDQRLRDLEEKPSDAGAEEIVKQIEGLKELVHALNQRVQNLEAEEAKETEGVWALACSLEQQVRDVESSKKTEELENRLNELGLLLEEYRLQGPESEGVVAKTPTTSVRKVLQGPEPVVIYSNSPDPVK